MAGQVTHISTDQDDVQTFCGSYVGASITMIDEFTDDPQDVTCDWCLRKLRRYAADPTRITHLERDKVFAHEAIKNIATSLTLEVESQANEKKLRRRLAVYVERFVEAGCSYHLVDAAMREVTLTALTFGQVVSSPPAGPLRNNREAKFLDMPTHAAPPGIYDPWSSGLEVGGCEAQRLLR